MGYAGNDWGAASAGVRYPETPFNGAFAPRIGFAYQLGSQTVLRAGYGVFYTQAFYPGWGGGMSLDGFNPQINFNDSLAGYEPSFYMDNGFPAYSKDPDVSLTADKKAVVVDQYTRKLPPTRVPVAGGKVSFDKRFAEDMVCGPFNGG